MHRKPRTLVAAVLAGLAVMIAMSGCSPREPLPALASPRILIEKSARRLTLLDGETPVRTYHVALGDSSLGDKEREGDRRTPVGEFYVCVKNPESRYHLSLGLSYPNQEDADRGLREGLISSAEYGAIVAAIGSGRRPPWDTALGGEIMIHGNGAGRDWTWGCLALDDADIEEIYHAVGLGTPVEVRE
jgi:murein L,D-transpeptidase YafK